MRFHYEATGIGSVPIKDAGLACRLIFDNFRSIPFWPQLPKKSFMEHMYCQFSEGMPGIVIDEDAKTIRIEREKCAKGMEKVYQYFIDGDIEYFSISESHAAGLHEFLKNYALSFKETDFVKGHITGPVSFALSVTDENKKALIYDKDIFDIVVKVLSMKARWQIKRLRHLNPNVIMFIDEPYLVSIGSSFINISMADAVKAIDEVNSAIKEEGAISGIHCCGNTDWSMLLKRGIDIINFDAYNFIREFSLYADDIKEFLKNNGTIAWGIVPSSEAAGMESQTAVTKRLKDSLRILSDKGIDAKNISSVITPSCGLGMLGQDLAEKIIKLTNSVSRAMEGS